MPDQSHLDNRYFVDTTIYNCPFCNRRHVSYSVFQTVRFDWTDKKRCFGYFVECHSCGKQSMHLTFKQLDTQHIGLVKGSQRWRFVFEKGLDAGRTLDETFFYSEKTVGTGSY